jgi:RNAse (barnase) inhibitor barstar
MPDPLDDLIDAAARALELPIEHEWKAAVKTNLQVTLRHGALVVAFKLPDEAEPAPVYVA